MKRKPCQDVPQSGTYEATNVTVSFAPMAAVEEFVGDVTGPRYDKLRDQKLASARKERAYALHLANLADYRATKIRDLEAKVEKLQKRDAEMGKEFAVLQSERDHLKSKCSNLQVRFETAFVNGLSDVAAAFARGLKG